MVKSLKNSLDVFCFEGPVTSADILISSGDGSRFIVESRPDGDGNPNSSLRFLCNLLTMIKLSNLKSNKFSRKLTLSYQVYLVSVNLI